MTGSIHNPHIETLLSLAGDDESTLAYPLPDQIFGFHAQQSCEKLLKALISAHNIKYELTHVMAKLLTRLGDCPEVLPALPFSLVALDPFAVQFRYEDSPDLTDADKVAIRQCVVILREHVVRRILELESAA